MGYRLLLVEPPKRYWFVMGDYNPPPTSLLILAAYLKRELPEIEVDLVDSQGQGLVTPSRTRWDRPSSTGSPPPRSAGRAL